MPYCPKCKSEYREGILVCPDCNCELVDQLTNEDLSPILYIKSEKILKRFVDYLSYSEIPTEVQPDPENNRNAIYCLPEDEERVRRAFSVFVAVETNNALASKNNTPLYQSDDNSDNALELFDGEDLTVPEDWEDALTEDAVEENSELAELLAEDAVSELTPAVIYRGGDGTVTQFVSAAEKQKEVHETGVMLVVFGLGLGAGVALCAFNNLLNPYALIVMGLIGIAMIVYGIRSFSLSSKFAEEAVAEEALIKKIKKHLDELSKEELFGADYAESAEDPEQDLVRQKALNDNLKEHFPDCDEALLQYLADEWYGKLFD